MNKCRLISIDIGCQLMVTIIIVLFLVFAYLIISKCICNRINNFDERINKLEKDLLILESKCRVIMNHINKEISGDKNEKC